MRKVNGLRIFFVTAAATALVWFGGPAATAAPQFAPASRAAAARSADIGVMSDPRVRALTAEEGRFYASRISADGAFRANTRGQLLIQRQRRAYEVIAGGVATGGPAGSSMIDQGLTAVRWGFDRSGPDGSFPQQGGRSVLARTFFVESSARALLLLRDARVSAQTKARARALEPAVRRSAEWIANSAPLRDALRSPGNTNLYFVVAAALQEAAALSDSAALRAKAQQSAAVGLSLQLPDGTFPERRGFDSNYQSVSLAFGARYASQLPPSPWRTRVLAALDRGAARLLRVIDVRTGQVDDRGNTRTVSCARPAAAARADNSSAADNLALRLYYIAHVLNRRDIAASAPQIESGGQDFRHVGECPGGPRRARPERGRRAPHRAPQGGPEFAAPGPSLR
jgi:hypothetical protein